MNSYTWCFLFEKINLRVQRNNTQNLECKEVRDQFYETLGFPIHCLWFDGSKITEDVWKKWGFLKTGHGLRGTPDLVYCFFELVS